MSVTDVIPYVICFLVGAFCDYLLSYMRQKGQNLATREDIGPITETIEKVKQEYSGKLEEVKSYLAAAIYRHNMGFQKEFEVYERSWKTVVDLLGATQNFQPGGYFAQPDENYEQRGIRLGNALRKASREFGLTIHYSRPFFPSEIFKLLQRFQRFVFKEAIRYGEEYAGRGRADLAKLHPERLGRVMKALSRQSETISEAMRRRVEALQRDRE